MHAQWAALLELPHPNPCQSPKTAWTSASAAIAAVSARKIRGPKAMRTTIGRRRSSSRSSSENPPFRANQDSKRLVRAPTLSEEGCHRITHLGILIAKDQQAIGRRRDLFEWHRFGNLRHPKNAALLGRLNRIGAHAIEIDARNLRVPGHDRLQPRSAHFDRFLHEIVEPCVLERRKQKMQIAGAGLRALLGADNQAYGTFAASSQRRPPLTIGSVEQQHSVSTLKPKHIKQVVRLVPIERYLAALGQRRVHVKSGRTKIVVRHGNDRFKGRRRAPVYAVRRAFARPGGPPSPCRLPDAFRLL